MAVRIGYKKARVYDMNDNYVGTAIITLQLCHGARAIVPNPSQVENRYQKCRTNAAQVVKMQFRNGHEIDETKYKVRSDHDYSFFYQKNKIVTPTRPFCYDKSKVCSSGIHYFQVRKQAVTYNFG
jgi:hypothetical protein